MEQVLFSQFTLEEIVDAFKKVLKESKENPKLVNSQTELITRKQTAKIIGISLPTLNEWSKRGVIPSYRIGTRVRYKKDEVMSCLTKVKTIKYR